METRKEIELASPRAQAAMDNFLKGYNCSQSIVLAFSDLIDMDPELLSKISCSFGGGMGRLREVCGSVSGMFMIISLLYGYSGPETGQPKTEQYKKVQELAKRFEEINGSIVCRQLLNLDVEHDSPNASPRTSEYYAKRPCKEIIGSAAQILDEFIKENPITVL